MDKINNFDHAKPLEDMDPKESIISNAGGVTQQKAEEIIDSNLEYDQKEAYKNIFNKPAEEIEKMSSLGKSIFNKYGLDVKDEKEGKVFDLMSKDMHKERLKVLEANIVLAMSNKNKDFESRRYYDNLKKEYILEIEKYERLYGEKYETNATKNIEDAKDILVKYTNPEDKH